MERLFRVRFVMRYTRISCMPLRATMEFDEIVQAKSAEDAPMQAAKCIDRDLEEILWAVSSMNVTEVILEFQSVTAATPDQAGDVWNPESFPDDELPRYVVLK